MRNQDSLPLVSPAAPSRRLVAFLLLAAGLVVLAYLLLYQQTEVYIRRHADQQRRDNLVRLVTVARNVVEPVVSRVRAGELGRLAGREEVRRLVRHMTYRDHQGGNYVFMSAYDGTVLVHPLAPELELTDRGNLRDERGTYLIRELVVAARDHPEGAFVTYRYPPPGSREAEEKLAFVLGIPELDCYLGTGSHVQHFEREQGKILGRARSWSLILLGFFALAVAVALRIILAGNRALRAEIEERGRAEARLRESEANLRTIFESVHDAVVVHGADGRIRHVNSRAEQLYGLSRGELTGRPVDDLAADPAADLAMVHAAWEKVLAGESLVLEARARRFVDGQSFAAEVALARGTWSGEPAVLALVRDVTAKKRTAERRRLDEARLQALLDLNQAELNTLDEIAAFGLAQAVAQTQSEMGYVAFVSEDEKTLTIHAWSEEAMRQCRIGRKPLVYPLEQTGLWGEAVRQRRPIITNQYEAPNPLKRGTPPGHVPIRRHLNLPVFEGDRVVLVAGVANKAAGYDHDDVRQLGLLMSGMWRILKQRQAEAALKESEARLRELFANISDVVFRHDLEGRLLDLSPAVESVLGYRPEELTGRKLGDLLAPEQGDPRALDYLEILQRDGLASGTLQLMAKDGEERILEFRSHLMARPGQPAGIWGSARDVTARVKAERELRFLENQLFQAQKMQAVGLLASGIAHDFNNILQAIGGHAQSLLADAGLVGKNRQRARRIEDGVSRAAELVRRLLTFGRKAEARLAPLDLNQAVVAVMAMLEHTFPKMIEVAVELAPGLPRLRGDAGQIEQVILNLCANAKDAMPAGGRLTLATARTSLDEEACRQLGELTPGDYLLLVVSDTGQGMPPEVQARIFEPFFTTKPLGQGTGLGLSTVYGIAKSHGGHVACQSTPGVGTRFTIHWPVPPEAQTLATPPPAADPLARGGNETLLLVDDEDDVLDLAGEALQAQGYLVLAARSGEEALELLARRATPPDLVILDLGMPGMGGWQCLARLREILPGLPVVVASGYAENGQRQRLWAEGAREFLPKPYRLVELLALVRRILDQRDAS